MHLREWVLSTSNDGARSEANCQFIDGLLRHGSLVARHGTTIAIDQISQQGTECIRLCFHLPFACQSNGVSSIAVLVPNACIGTGIIKSNQIFYALIEETIGWLACVGPKHTLVRLYLENNRQPLPRSYSSNWVQRRNNFTLFITSLRPSYHQSGLGQMSGAVGAMEVAQAMTSSQDTSGDYVVTLTLRCKQQKRLFLPRSVAQLPEEWRLDWLEVQNEFSTQA